MSDVTGVGRIVDEASEVLDSLDRPFISRTTVEKIGRKTVTTNVSLSKLDTGFLVIIFCIIIRALEYRLSTGKSWAEDILVSMNPFENRILGSGMYSEDTDGNKQSGVQKAAAGSMDTGLLTLFSPAAGFAKFITDLSGGKS